MRNLIIYFLLLLTSFVAFGGDVITLANQQRFEGKVKKIKDCVVYFKAKKETFLIPTQDIFSIEFHNPRDKVLTAYLALTDTLSAVEKCLRGRQDAALFHGKEADHFLFGLLFGLVGVVGAAVANPTPLKGESTYELSQNRELFNDPKYLECYRKKAIAKNVGKAFVGWTISVFVILFYYGSKV